MQLLAASFQLLADRFKANLLSFEERAKSLRLKLIAVTAKSSFLPLALSFSRLRIEANIFGLERKELEARG